RDQLSGREDVRLVDDGVERDLRLRPVQAVEEPEGLLLPLPVLLGEEEVRRVHALPALGALGGGNLEGARKPAFSSAAHSSSLLISRGSDEATTSHGGPHCASWMFRYVECKSCPGHR